MCLDELHDLCSRAGFVSENFVERDVNMVNKYIFNHIQGVQPIEVVGG